MVSKNARRPKIATFTVAESPTHRLTCTTKGIDYRPDSMKHVYGKSTRPPLEDWFLRELEFFQHHYAGYEIFTLGSTCVFGERFVTYLTACEFSLASDRDFEKLRRALRDSDQAIRKKGAVLWKWDLAARRDNKIVFFVGFLDFAYFLHHRGDFRNDEHARYMRSFIGDAKIQSKDFKVLHDGTLAPFDETLLSAKDRRTYDSYEQITFESTPRGRKGAKKP